MKRSIVSISLTAVGALLLTVVTPAFAHRVDEYLQATMISVAKGKLHVQLRLTPGIAVFERVLAGIDVNADGMISDAEQRSYAERVRRDLSLEVDGARVPLRFANARFPSVAEMKEGLGEITLDLDAAVPPGGRERRLTFENRHERSIAVYLVNALVPSDSAIRITGQSRSREQSTFQLDYSVDDASLAQADPAVVPPARAEWSGYLNMVRLGMHHIADGTDHLLFLLTLLLPAPLVATAGRWSGSASARRTAAQLLRIVTAFTIGHSITLAAAAAGVVRAPSAAVEVLVAVSILVSAAHALRPLFPGREAFVAGGFGLVHGLAFATMIAGYGIDPWHTALTVLGFNLGIEAMQLVVVVATVPWLLLLGRTPVYWVVRSTSAVFAGVAALGWIGERALGLDNPMAPSVERAAEHGAAVLVALALLATMTSVWHRSRQRGRSLSSPAGESA